ncbi:MAG: class I SAM-dependent methyltransferase [Calditrichaeota bacterium]|nr:MAG: class I SAM-dependent methyltransferase [Calditrichota bacterium]
MSSEHEARIDKSHYFNARYLKRERMYSFVEQIELIKQFAQPEDTLLEIGKGNGFVSDFCQRYLGYRVTTVDVNPDLQPDIVDDITQPRVLKENSADVVMCYEVLEHMPFEQSVQAVRSMTQLARKYVLISVPDMRYFISGRMTVFGTGPVFLQKLLSTRRFRNAGKKFGDDHHWEIGLKTPDVTYSAEYVRRNLFGGVTIVRDYRDIAVPWHHYYVVKAG